MSVAALPAAATERLDARNRRDEVDRAPPATDPMRGAVWAGVTWVANGTTHTRFSRVARCRARARASVRKPIAVRPARGQLNASDAISASGSRRTPRASTRESHSGRGAQHTPNLSHTAILPARPNTPSGLVHIARSTTIGARSCDFTTAPKPHPIAAGRCWHTRTVSRPCPSTVAGPSEALP